MAILCTSNQCGRVFDLQHTSLTGSNIRLNIWRFCAFAFQKWSYQKVDFFWPFADGTYLSWVKLFMFFLLFLKALSRFMSSGIYKTLMDKLGFYIFCHLSLQTFHISLWLKTVSPILYVINALKLQEMCQTKYCSLKGKLC